VLPAWVDYNRHMTEAAYLTAFGWASDALFTFIGDDDAYRAAGHSFYTVETHIAYLREAQEGAPLRITTRVLGVDRKRLLIYHEMFHRDNEKLLGTTEQMLVHVDMNAARSVAILPEVRAALDAIAAVHSTLPAPARAGHFSLPNPE
jgi:carnitine 3-dehydrogenase